jgi:hypothetical protein
MKYTTLTIKADNILEAIFIPVAVNESKLPCLLSSIEVIEPNAIALIDTGSSKSSISNELIAALGLKADSPTHAYSVSGKYPTKAYYIDILLQSGARFANVKALEFIKTKQVFDIIIGMDILTLGDLAITNYNHQTVMSFTVPSGAIHIDFISENTEEN